MPPATVASGTIYATARELRQSIRQGQFTGPTAGQAPGFVQTNVVILPATAADDFELFCRRNVQACPLVARSRPGDATLADVAAEADLRTDVSGWRVFRQGRPDTTGPRDLRALWRDDFVVFLIGCSFTFENALVQAGLRVRHIDERRNVPMYRTNRACEPAGPFRGPLVVSMRPYRPEQVAEVAAITGRYPRMHGAPVHVGDPAALGIVDLARPDFGDAVTVRDGEVPVFWACGVTPQAALESARLDIAITHHPGCMFVTDLRDSDFRETNA
ncbi:MAG: putative hydro-lyase [Planctomycetes bacterium]|nr:putative hydro-lyase [Planctomycetota bacterium]